MITNLLSGDLLFDGLDPGVKTSRRVMRLPSKRKFIAGWGKKKRQGDFVTG
jgi:hypothetical protein